MKNLIILSFLGIATIFCSCSNQDDPVAAAASEYTLADQLNKDFTYVQVDSIPSERKGAAFDAAGEPLKEGRWYLLSRKGRAILPAHLPHSIILEKRKIEHWRVSTMYPSALDVYVEVSLVGFRDVRIDPVLFLAQEQ